MPRLVFEKKGNGIWISHLDLMRLFQRAFKRAGLPLKHTQGFNPRPSVSIALPLSVGVQSCCELLDFELDGAEIPCQEITDRLNAVLVPGIRVKECLDGGRKLRDLSLLSCSMELIYENEVPAGAGEAIYCLLTSGPVIVSKKSKRSGIQGQDIGPMIRSVQIQQTQDKVLQLNATVTCQNPTLNPMQIHSAIEKYLPQYRADFVKYQRLEIFDNENVIFR